MIKPLPASGHQRLRIALAVLTAAIGIAAAVWIVDFSRQSSVLRAARQAWQDNGIALLALFAAAVVVGTLSQTWWAWRNGRRLRMGWVNAIILIAYGLAIAALAWMLAPGGSGFSGGRGGGANGAYLAWLVFVLLPPGAVTAAGAHFPVDTADATTARIRPVPVALIAGWCFGAIPFILLLVAALAG